MYQFTIQSNEYLKQNIVAFYHTDYIGFQRPGNPDYINILKNTYNSYAEIRLKGAVQELTNVLLEDLPQILQKVNQNTLTVCVVPRAKAESTYHENQLLFKSTVKSIVNKLNGFIDGTNYIIRHTNTRTTHLRGQTPNYINDGAAPYPGITAHTCNISNAVINKHILLIDDIYTKTVNIDEDAIQALLNKGAQSVTFYAVARTVHNRFNM